MMVYSVVFGVNVLFSCIGLPQVPSASGAHPDDYIASDVPHFRTVQEYPISDFITRAINENTNGFCTMGSFPELKMAWAAVDTNLYVWPWDKYEKITTIIYPEFITAVDLLATWSHDLMYLASTFVIVTATLSEVLFSSVVSSGSSYTIDTENFVLRASTNEVHFCKIKCTKEGRVFLGSSEGHVSELQNIKETFLTKWFRFGPRLANCTLAVYERIASAVPGFHLLFRKEPVIQMIMDETRKVGFLTKECSTVDTRRLN